MSKAVNRRRKRQVAVMYTLIAVGAVVLAALIWRAVRMNREGARGAAQPDTQEAVETLAPTGGTETGDTGTASADETGAAETQAAEEVSYEPIVSDQKLKSFGSVVVVGDAAFELYNYREDTAKKYAKAVSRVAKQLDGEAEVYSILVPLGSGICFPDNLRDQVNSSDQRKAIADIYALERKSVHKLSLYDALMQHRTEYIYFRTDHHWTALGAYYAYREFCREKGIVPNGLDAYETVEYDGFVGSFYLDTNADKLKKHPDTVLAYEPLSDTKLKIKDSDGKSFTWAMIGDVSGYAAGLKYSTFAGGDNPVTVITNESTDSKESCVVVKDSFGNALLPFLSDHYKKIYEVDFRYWSGDVAELAKRHDVTDVIFVNNLSMTRNKYLVAQLQGIIN